MVTPLVRWRPPGPTGIPVPYVSTYAKPPTALAHANVVVDILIVVPCGAPVRRRPDVLTADIQVALAATQEVVVRREQRRDEQRVVVAANAV